MNLKSIHKFFIIEIPKNRVFGLDLLRMIAISIVVISHAGILLDGEVRQLYDLFIFKGGVGVSIFFVLSGFLIGGILLKTISNIDEKKISLKVLIHFWKRRWFRTLPTYYLILTILIFLEFIFNSKFTLRGVNRYLFFCQSLNNDISEFFFVESWSLSIEECFYIIFPLITLVISLFNLDNKKAFITSAIIMIIFPTLYRIYYYGIVNSEINDFINSTFSRLDSISFGVIASYFCHYYYEIWLKRKNVFFIIGLLIFILYKPFIESSTNYILVNIISYSLVSIATLLTLPYLSCLRFVNQKYKIITRISLMSYSKY